MKRSLAFGFIAWVLTLSCTPGWNDPPPITPEPGLPCGRVYHQCPATGGCCAMDEVCGREGHACGVGECCFVGEGTMTKRKRAQLFPGDGGRPLDGH
jgi:hypothetical protein